MQADSAAEISNETRDTNNGRKIVEFFQMPQATKFFNSRLLFWITF